MTSILCIRYTEKSLFHHVKKLFTENKIEVKGFYFNTLSAYRPTL